jgi:putative membrane protein
MKPSLTAAGDLLATLIGLFSVGLGIITIIMATIVYFKKINSINGQTFVASKKYIVTLSVFIIFIALLFGIYFVIV